MQPLSEGTIDITDLVEKTRSAFVDWAVTTIYAEEIATPGLEWVGLPVVKDIDQAILRAVLDALSKQAIMQAFFMNTTIRKASQAKDFLDALNAKNALPADATKEQYEQAERNQMDAFRRFVVVTN